MMMTVRVSRTQAQVPRMRAVVTLVAAAPIARPVPVIAAARVARTKAKIIQSYIMEVDTLTRKDY